MAENNETMIQMDMAATEAAAELQELAKQDPDAFVKLAAWMLKWYMKAGYKRLAKALIGIAKA